MYLLGPNIKGICYLLHITDWIKKEIIYHRYTIGTFFNKTKFGLMVIFGHMVWSYGQNYLVVLFLFIWFFGFGLMSESPIDRCSASL